MLGGVFFFKENITFLKLIVATIVRFRQSLMSKVLQKLIDDQKSLLPDYTNYISRHKFVLWLYFYVF